MPLVLADLEHLGESALQDFGRDVAQANCADRVELEKQAQRLEARLE